MWVFMHQQTQQRHPPVSPITEGGPMSSGRRRKSFRGGTASSGSLFGDGSSGPPEGTVGGVVNADAVAVGPQCTTGVLNRLIASQVCVCCLCVWMWAVRCVLDVGRVAA